MADIFISYARKDRQVAERIADALVGQGWSVWWDRKIHVGRSFSRVIEKQLDAARCVVVLWSRASIESDWVLSEAAEGARRRVLIPICVDDVRPPLEFRRLHTAMVLSPTKDLSGPDFAECSTAIRELIAVPSLPSTHIPADSEHDARETATASNDNGTLSPRTLPDAKVVSAPNFSTSVARTDRTSANEVSHANDDANQAAESRVEPPPYSSSPNAAVPRLVLTVPAVRDRALASAKTKERNDSSAPSIAEVHSQAELSQAGLPLLDPMQLTAPRERVNRSTASKVPRSRRLRATHLIILLLFVLTAFVGIHIVFRDNALKSGQSESKIPKPSVIPQPLASRLSQPDATRHANATLAVKQDYVGEWRFWNQLELRAEVFSLVRVGDEFTGEYWHDQRVERLHGKIQADNRLHLVNVRWEGKLAGTDSGSENVFAQEAWLQLSNDGHSVLVSPRSEARVVFSMKREVAQ